MNHIDTIILTFLNQFALRSPIFDMFMVGLSGLVLLKGGLVMALMWGIWFQDDGKSNHVRATILATILGALVALFLVKLLTVSLPFRLSPIHDPNFDFQIPYGASYPRLQIWSSFPSDHAALFFALTTGMFLVSRRLGFLALVYVLTIICVPRMYLGLHYVTDIIAGALVGIGTTTLANIPRVKVFMTKSLLSWSVRHAPSFYGGFFFLTFEIAELFKHIRFLGRGLWKVLDVITG